MQIRNEKNPEFKNKDVHKNWMRMRLKPATNDSREGLWDVKNMRDARNLQEKRACKR